MDQHTTHEAPTLVHTTTTRHGILVVRVAGTLDTALNQHVASELDALLDSRPVAVVVDLRAVDFMGSASIAMLLNAQHHAGRLGVPFAIVADNHSVVRPLQTSQVYGVLAMSSTVDEAITAVRLASA
ncbi:STAS domain-containing protein [Nocardia sp. NRRL S-836]|uniref:STAS domain-containing protein n=1 Tax=Nocardia sp. NRRL S-836 TaxID=1519492 RepID=UPI0006AE93DF|nr:STAS domain-containing protein [Nocardia sp. NRRL S-836]